MEGNNQQKIVATKLLSESMQNPYYSERKMNTLSTYDSSEFT